MPPRFIHIKEVTENVLLQLAVLLLNDEHSANP
jgi:hypothetical protein